MIVYEATKQEFLKDVFDDCLVDNIHNNYTKRFGKVNKAEIRAWDNSMQYMFNVMSDSEIPEDAGVAIEFKIPYTSKRVDFLVSGRNGTQENIVIVELKQWESAKKVENKQAIVETFINKGIREVTHPSYQAWSYAMLIQDYNETVQNDNIQMYPCAYLHNYIKKENDPLLDSVYHYYVEQAPVFRKGDAAKLRDFIKRYITIGDNKAGLYKIENGRIRPSKSLQDNLNSMLKGNEEFVMIDDQKVVFEQAKFLAQKALRTGKKQVLIVQGGPGTGKSVLAINLLVELTSKSLVCQYVTKNSAPRQIYSTKLKGDFRKGQIDNLFKGSGCYVDAPKDEFDVLIVDEAHRLNEKSGMFQNLGENQVKEIIGASKLAIFFIDENQRVTLKDIGSVEMIKYYAAKYNSDVCMMDLQSQFRCNGSDGYLAWIDDVLGIRETANENDIGSNYDFRIFSNPNDMRQEIERLNKINNKSRMVAGYCWKWIKEGKNHSDFHDITIPEHNFSISWNLGNSATWAIDETSVNEAGCIHTCQGLEFDYVGVIIGLDLIYRDGQVVTDYTKRASTDQSIKGIKKMMKENPEKANKLAEEIIKNTYRTLMTRGQKGCFVYCVDKELENYLKHRWNRVCMELEGNEFFKTVMKVAEKKEEYK